MKILLIGGAAFAGYLWYRGGMSTSDPLHSLSSGWAAFTTKAKPNTCPGCVGSTTGNAIGAPTGGTCPDGSLASPTCGCDCWGSGSV